eukprot:11631891-Alexandrium_andersonii.AAC.1
MHEPPGPVERMREALCETPLATAARSAVVVSQSVACGLPCIARTRFAHDDGLQALCAADHSATVPPCSMRLPFAQPSQPRVPGASSRTEAVLGRTGAPAPRGYLSTSPRD